MDSGRASSESEASVLSAGNDESSIGNDASLRMLPNTPSSEYGSMRDEQLVTDGHEVGRDIPAWAVKTWKDFHAGKYPPVFSENGFGDFAVPTVNIPTSKSAERKRRKKSAISPISGSERNSEKKSSGSAGN